MALVTFGGADPLGLTVPAARAVRDALAGAAQGRWLELQVVVGPAFADGEQVARELEGMECRLRRGPGRAELASLMARSVFAVAAFGTSLYELAALGVPVVYWTHRAADLADAGRLEAAGLGALGGDGGAFSAAACQATLGRTVLDSGWRLAASARGRALLAGADGAKRIVQLMETGVPAGVAE
jgi:spore coat polysaccharide biosynthesis predicted glycosyltransferase SpsG